MLIQKLLTLTIFIDSYNDLFSGDMNGTLKRLIEVKYKNVCYKSILIKNVISIGKYGNINIVDNMLSGYATVDVEVLIEGIIYSQNEIVTDCEVLKIYENAITVNGKYTGATITANSLLTKTLVIGDKIPIVIKQSRYMIGSDRIASIGEPLMPMFDDNPIFSIDRSLDSIEVLKINELYAMINKELDMHKKISKLDNYKGFVGILYPFNAKQDYLKQPKIKKMKLAKYDIQLLSKITVGNVVVYPNELNKMDGEVYYAKTGVGDSSVGDSSVGDSSVGDSSYDLSSSIVVMSAYNVISYVLNKYLLYLIGLRELVDSYKTMDDMRRSATYWILYKKMKR